MTTVGEGSDPHSRVAESTSVLRGQIDSGGETLDSAVDRAAKALDSWRRVLVTSH